MYKHSTTPDQKIKRGSKGGWIWYEIGNLAREKAQKRQQNT